MLIESRIRRAKGTRVTLDGTEYHFTPNKDGVHVADVSNADHIDRFLAVPEGFRVVVQGRKEKPVEPDPTGLTGAPVNPVTPVTPVTPVPPVTTVSQQASTGDATPAVKPRRGRAKKGE